MPDNIAGYDALAQKLAAAPPADGASLMAILQAEGYELAPTAGGDPMGDPMGGPPMGGDPLGDLGGLPPGLGSGPPMEEEPMSIEGMRMSAVKNAFGSEKKKNEPPRKGDESDDEATA